MTIERLVLAFAGFFILASLVLAHWVNPNWLWFTAFVGANLLQSAFTGFCPLAIILRRLGREYGPAFCRNRETAAEANAACIDPWRHAAFRSPVSEVNHNE